MCIKDDIIDKHNNAYQRTIKVKPINFVVESNDRDPKFKVGEQVIISKYKSLFAKGYTPEEVFVIKKV